MVVSLVLVCVAQLAHVAYCMRYSQINTSPQAMVFKTSDMSAGHALLNERQLFVGTAGVG